MRYLYKGLLLIGGAVLLGGCEYENPDAVAEMYSTLSPEEQAVYRNGEQFDKEARINELLDELIED